jgi:hypothetical protein
MYPSVSRVSQLMYPSVSRVSQSPKLKHLSSEYVPTYKRYKLL